jgi:hypothetical protein
MGIRSILTVGVILGSAVGVGAAYVRVNFRPWDGTGEGPKAHQPAPLLAPAASSKPVDASQQPMVFVQENTFDFGTMDSGSVASHDFLFTNRGNGVLTLAKGSTTCKCTMANLERAEIAPGESTKVKLEWKAKGFNGPYAQTANVLTNDANRPTVTLSISGRIVSAVKLVPDGLVLSSVTAGESASGTVAAYGCVSEPLKITGQELVEAGTARFFEVKCVPMKPDEVAKDKDAKSGVLVQVNLKPGLPVGPFKQTIRLKSNLAASPTIDVGVSGSVVSDIAVVGARWDEKYGVLSVGSVSSRDEVARTLFVIARGPDREKVKLKVAEVWPAFLKAEIGPTIETSGGVLRQTPVIIRIPKGSPPAIHLGTETSKCGRILLETGHPRAPQLLIRVLFAVEG